MVRFELDAVNEAAPRPTKTKDGNNKDADSLANAMQGTSVSNNLFPFPKSSETKEWHQNSLNSLSFTSLFLIHREGRRDQLKPNSITSMFTFN
jgi:hypothetical protein